MSSITSQVMKNSNPRVSVVIPAYNQAEYLGDAIQSVLSQTYQDFEIIVIDDGSTDKTPLVANEFSENVCYIRQENKGLAGARNTGIQNAKGTYIALIDSDDIWLPIFLQKMMALVADVPDAIVYYCSARYIDAKGNELPQIVASKFVPDETMYETLVKANFIIPSTVVMLRSAVLAAGLFDDSFRACEDWDLWLRLAPTCHFTSIRDCLVNYRLHGSSLSADPSKMQQAVKAVIEKHFGPDDEDMGKWPNMKRMAYGGVYRYHAWTSVLKQKNWDDCAQYTKKALRVDPTISKDLGFFFDLAMGAQPLGHRGTSKLLDLQSNAIHLKQMLSEVFDKATPSAENRVKSDTYGTTYFGLGLVAYNTGQYSLCRNYLFRALRYRPDLWQDTRVLGNILKSFLGRPILGWLRKMHGKQL
jgi:glycosyltransferase involved in cell wall biosynthesis